MNTRIICLAGQRSAGKDSLAYAFHRLLPTWRNGSFAATLYRMVADLFGVSVEWLKEWKNNPEPPPGWQRPVREALKEFGELARTFRTNIWLEKAMLPAQLGYGVIGADTRHNNELEGIHARGGFTILCWRPCFENTDPHPSESEILPYVQRLKDFLPRGGPCRHLEPNLDYFAVNDGTLPDWHNQASLILPLIP